MNGTINFTSPAHLQNLVAIGNGEPDSEKKNTNPDYHWVGNKQNFSPYDSYHVKPLSRQHQIWSLRQPPGKHQLVLPDGLLNYSLNI